MILSTTPVSAKEDSQVFGIGLRACHPGANLSGFIRVGSRYRRRAIGGI